MCGNIKSSGIRSKNTHFKFTYREKDTVKNRTGFWRIGSVSDSAKVLSGELGSMLTEDVRCILEVDKFWEFLSYFPRSLWQRSGDDKSPPRLDVFLGCLLWGRFNNRCKYNMVKVVVKYMEEVHAWPENIGALNVRVIDRSFLFRLLTQSTNAWLEHDMEWY